MEKNSEIQVLRALSVIAVVLIHTCPGGIYQIIFRPFLNFCVAMFIFLSGFLTKLENDDWFAFCKKRIVRVLIPYIMWSVLYSLSDGGDTKKILTDLITTRSALQLYYVFIYIQFVLLTPFMAKLIKSKYSWTGWLISPVSTMLLKYSWILLGIQPGKTFSIVWRVCCLGWFTFYYLGLILGNKVNEYSYTQKKLVFFGSLSIVLQMLETSAFLRIGIADCGSQVKLTAFLTSSICILLAYNHLKNDSIKIKNKWLVRAGDCSFGIYLSHIMVMKVLYHIPFYTSLPYIINSGLLFIATFMCVIAGQKICGKSISKLLGLI